MAGKFEITKDAEGRFRFWLKASNGAIIATSGEDYESKARRDERHCFGPEERPRR